MSNKRKFAIAIAIIPLIVVFVWWRIGSHLENRPKTVAGPTTNSTSYNDPFTKVIAEVEVPPGDEDESVWSEAVMLPDPNGPQFRARLAIPTSIKIYGPDGKELEGRRIVDSREDKVGFYGLPEGSSARFASLIPGQGGTLQFLVKE